MKPIKNFTEVLSERLRTPEDYAFKVHDIPFYVHSLGPGDYSPDESEFWISDSFTVGTGNHVPNLVHGKINWERQSIKFGLRSKYSIAFKNLLTYHFSVSEVKSVKEFDLMLYHILNDVESWKELTTKQVTQ